MQLAALVNSALDAAESGNIIRHELGPGSVPGGSQARLIGDCWASETMDQSTLYFWKARGAQNASPPPNPGAPTQAHAESNCLSAKLL